MNYLYKLLILITACLLITSCYRKDTVTLELSVPELAGEACGDVIRRALTKDNSTKMEMVRAVEFDYSARKVIVTYNAKLTAIKNIQHAITHAGFSVDELPPFPGSESKRPAECK